MIALASDHAGFEFKEEIKTLLDELDLSYKDFGTDSAEPVDYPDFGHAAAEAVSSGECDRGILVCGSGIGMSIVANKSRGVRAAECVTPEMAAIARKHNNANMLTLGERIVTWGIATEIIETFLSTAFEGGRHERRVAKISALTGK